MNSFGIHWFRRDLRVAGNSALKWNWKQNQGRTLGVFFFDSKFLEREDFSHNRFGFFLQTLKALREELREIGGDLWVIDREPSEGFDFLFKKLGQAQPSCVSFNRDYEPFARTRDQKITELLKTRGIEVHTERDHLFIEPGELVKESGDSDFYQIFTPFFKKWSQLSHEAYFKSRISGQSEALSYLEKRRKQQTIEPFFKLKWKEVVSDYEHSDALESFISRNAPRVRVSLPPAGSLAAYEKLVDFEPHLSSYLDRRDFPATTGTSQLSPYFKNGSISSSLVLAYLELSQVRSNEKTSRMQYLKELAWREFYYHILYHRPSVEKEAFLQHYKDIKWENREERFEAWKEGKTGYPIVDAGMRELKETGWMHNRVRMIVASFLTKDLLIDWRWGEKHFMNELIDGDLAPNNGGWQWAASTGCDPQPYFRIFNPLLQSKKFDPQGEYIRRYVPELRRLSAADIHEPGDAYVEPIVHHASQKFKTLALYKR